MSFNSVHGSARKKEIHCSVFPVGNTRNLAKKIREAKFKENERKYRFDDAREVLRLECGFAAFGAHWCSSLGYNNGGFPLF